MDSTIAGSRLSTEGETDKEAYLLGLSTQASGKSVPMGYLCYQSLMRRNGSSSGLAFQVDVIRRRRLYISRWKYSA